MERTKISSGSDPMIDSILRADAEAKNRTLAAKEKRASEIAELPKEKEAFRKQYESETETMLGRTRDYTQKEAAARLELILKERERKLKKLDQVASDRTAAWVEQIYSSIVRR